MYARLALMLKEPRAQRLWQAWAEGHHGDKAGARKELDAGNVAESLLRDLMLLFNDVYNVFAHNALFGCSSLNIFLRTLPDHVRRTFGLGASPSQKGGEGGAVRRRISGGGGGVGGGGDEVYEKLTSALEKLVETQERGPSDDADKQLMNHQRYNSVLAASSARLDKARARGDAEDDFFLARPLLNCEI